MRPPIPTTPLITRTRMTTLTDRVRERQRKTGQSVTACGENTTTVLFCRRGRTSAAVSSAERLSCCSQESGRTGRRTCSAARRRPSVTTCSRASAGPPWTVRPAPTCAVRRTAGTFAGRPRRLAGGRVGFTSRRRVFLLEAREDERNVSSQVYL